MAKTSQELQTDYRERMYAAGYKQTRLWVPRDSEGKGVKMERKAFIKKLDELTVGWSEARLSRLFSELVKAIKAKNKEAEKKK